jgi:hypothetical protein
VKEVIVMGIVRAGVVQQGGVLKTPKRKKEEEEEPKEGPSVHL